MRHPEVYTYVDPVYWEKKRAIDHETYREYCEGRGMYEILADTEEDRTYFTFEYQDDGSVTEEGYYSRFADGEYRLKYKNNYTFDENNRLLSMAVHDVNTDVITNTYTNFCYEDTYTSFDDGNDRRYWEEHYDTKGILTSHNFPTEWKPDQFEFQLNNELVSKYLGGHSRYIRFDYNYKDNFDECGNITSRSKTMDISLGTGKELIRYKDGRTEEGSIWQTFQSDIPNMEVYFYYVYCKPSEIKAKTEEFESNFITSSDFIISNSSVAVLTEEDLADLSKSELRIARNEIFARHGYIFSSEDLDQLFRSYSWYKPTTPAEDFDIETELNEIEKSNIALIEEYEAKQ